MTRLSDVQGPAGGWRGRSLGGGEQTVQCLEKGCHVARFGRVEIPHPCAVMCVSPLKALFLHGKLWRGYVGPGQMLL